jgi:purine nucleosidase
VVRIHLDTDFGGDPDDACALALLLGWSGVEIVGITTNLDAGGHRAGCVAHYLRLANRSAIPLAAGAGVTLTNLQRYQSTAKDPRCWAPQSIAPLKSPPGAAVDLLWGSIEQGATIVAIGAITNLAMLAVARPGCLENISVVFTGGWLGPPAAGFPQWGLEMDFNVQCDPQAVFILSNTARLTLVPFPVSLKAHLRSAHLPRLSACGPIGDLLARQSIAHADDRKMFELARTHAALPNDLLNFHYDPVTAAVALGWPGVCIEEMRLEPRLTNGLLHFERSAAGRPTRVVLDIDGEAFAELWLSTVEALSARSLK